MGEDTAEARSLVEKDSRVAGKGAFGEGEGSPGISDEEDGGVIAGSKTEGPRLDVLGTGSREGGLKGSDFSLRWRPGEGDEGNIHGGDGMEDLPVAKSEGIAVRPEDRFFTGLPVGELDGILSEVIDGGVPEAEGAPVFGKDEEPLFLSHRAGIIFSDGEGERTVEVPLEAVAGGLVEAGGKLDLGGAVADTEPDRFDKENPALEDNAGGFQVGAMEAAEEIDTGSGAEADRLATDGIAFHGGSLDRHLVMGLGGAEKEVPRLVIGIEAADLGGEWSPFCIEGKIEEIHVGMVPLEVTEIKEHVGVIGIKAVAENAKTALGKEDAAKAGIAGEGNLPGFLLPEGPEVPWVLEKVVAEVKDGIPAHEFPIPEAGEFGTGGRGLEEPLKNGGKGLSPVKASGSREGGIAVHEMEAFRELVQDGAPVGEAPFAVAAIGMEIPFDMVLKDAGAGFAEGGAFAEFGEEEAKLELEPGGEDGPVSGTVALFAVFKDQPAGGTEEGFQETAEGEGIDLAGETEKAGREEEIDETDTADGETEFVEDDIVAGPGAGNGFALLVPLIEEAGPGFKAGGILIFNRCVEKAVHPGKVVEAVLCGDAAGGVEIDRPGEIVDLRIELVGGAFEDPVCETGISRDAGKDRVRLIEKGMDWVGALNEMGPEAGHGLLKVTLGGRFFPWVRWAIGVSEVLEKSAVGDVNNTFGKIQMVVGHGRKMIGAFTVLRLTFWLGIQKEGINRELSIW